MKCIICKQKVLEDRDVCKVCEQLMDYIHEDDIELILLTSAAVGIFAGQLGVGKNHCMACLIVPVILYFVM